MTVPRSLIVHRLQANVDTLLANYSASASKAYSVEISDPFRSTSQSGAASPFIKSLFPEIKPAATLERSLNTALGWGWDKIAADIAHATYGNGECNHMVTGSISAAAANAIESVVTGYRAKPRRVPDTKTELASILPSVHLSGAQEPVEEKDDTFFIDSTGVEHHVEIKTPKPNYDQMKAAKRRILRIHAVRAPEAVRAVVGMPYNPNGRYGVYGWPVTAIYLDPAIDLLVGEAFWNYVGNDPLTYEELLDCFFEVGRDRRLELIKLLAD